MVSTLFYLRCYALSLQALGLTPEEILTTGVSLLNVQLLGMVIGGFSFGILADKYGRRGVLFGSIVLYSLATFLNAYVTSIPWYFLYRFLAGIGLGAEGGIAITLVSELLSKNKRGFLAPIVATTISMGACLASLIGHYFDWQTAYMIGGIMGFSVLIFRVSARESDLFKAIHNDKSIEKGKLKLLFSDQRLKKYLICVFAGTPFAFIFYVLLNLTPEIGKALEISTPLTTALVAINFQIALIIGDVICAFASVKLASRKKPMLVFILAAFVSTFILFFLKAVSAETYYFWWIPMGFCAGFWSVFMSMTAEQFGTNLRATVATSVPNVVRASAIIMNILILFFAKSIGLILTLQILGVFIFCISIWCLLRLDETYGVDLNYIEQRTLRKND